jgi:hypothetical protein
MKRQRILLVRIRIPMIMEKKMMIMVRKTTTTERKMTTMAVRPIRIPAILQQRTTIIRAKSLLRPLSGKDRLQAEAP